MRKFRALLVSESSGCFPLGLACLKTFVDSDPAAARRASVSVEYVADIARPEAVLALRPDLVGFSTYGDPGGGSLRRLSAGCARLKALDPKLRIVLGGPAATGMRPEELFGSCAADFAVCGEGETAFRDLLLALAGRGGAVRGIPGLLFRDGGTIRATAARPVMSALEPLPSPYLSGAFDLGRHTRFHVEGSRGCPFTCGYCAMPGPVPRYFSEERMLKEVRRILSASAGPLQIEFTDADFLLHGARSGRLLKELAALSLEFPVSFGFFANLRHLDRKRAASLASGAFFVNIGVQSINPPALAAAGRGTEPGRLKRNMLNFLRLAPEAKASVDLIYGLPEDTLGGFRTSLDWGISAGCNLNAFHLGIPPGSRFDRERGRFGIKSSPDYPYFEQFNRSFSAADMAEASKLVYHIGFMIGNMGQEAFLGPFIRLLGRAVSKSSRRPYLLVCEELASFMKADKAFAPLVSGWSGGDRGPGGGERAREYRAALVPRLLSFCKKILRAGGRREAGAGLEKLAAAAAARLLFHRHGAWRKETADRLAGPRVPEGTLLLCREDSHDYRRLPFTEAVLLRGVQGEVPCRDAATAAAGATLELRRTLSGLGALAERKKRFGSIIVSGVLSSLPEKERPKFLSRLAGLAVSGGRLLLFDDLTGSPDPAGLVKGETEKSVAASLRKAGWTEIRVLRGARISGSGKALSPRPRAFLASRKGRV